MQLVDSHTTHCEKEKKTKLLESRKLGHFFLNHQVVGTGSPRGIQEAFLHRPPAPCPHEAPCSSTGSLYTSTTLEDGGNEGLQIRLQSR